MITEDDPKNKSVHVLKMSFSGLSDVRCYISMIEITFYVVSSSSNGEKDRRVSIGTWPSSSNEICWRPQRGERYEQPAVK